jgi:hypothetical protein
MGLVVGNSVRLRNGDGPFRVLVHVHTVAVAVAYAEFDKMRYRFQVSDGDMFVGCDLK